MDFNMCIRIKYYQGFKKEHSTLTLLGARNEYLRSAMRLLAGYLVASGARHVQALLN